MTAVNEVEPVRVHVASTDVPFTSPGQPRKRYATECRTIVITADDKVQKLVDLDENREEFWVQPIDFDIVICHSKAQAQDPGNTPIASNINVGGSLLPKTNLQMSGPFKGTDDLWMVSVNNVSPYPNRVSVMITRCVYT